MEKAQQQINVTEPLSGLNFNTITESIKAKLLAGDTVRVIDYPEQQRHDVVGAISTLRDQLPIVSGWQTLRQSYLSETRTRARRYHIPEAFLREVVA